MKELGRGRTAGLSLPPLLLLIALAVGPLGLALAGSLSHASPSRSAAVPGGAHGGRTRPPPSGGPASFAVRPPPADRPLIWFEAVAEQVATTVRLHAVDWGGHDVGSLELPCETPCWTQASPDGQRVLVGEQRDLGQEFAPATVFDSAGRQLGQFDGFGPQWADDSRHLCVLHELGAEPGSVSSVTRAALEILDSNDGSDRLVANVDAPRAILPSWWLLLSCSSAADRAVLSMNDRGGVESIQVVQLTSGRVLSVQDDPGYNQACRCRVDSLLVSHDGAVGAENLIPGGMRLGDLSHGGGASWGARPTAQIAVQGLSWNVRRAVTNGGVVDLATGRVLWRGPPAWGVRLAAAQPGGDDVMVLVSPPSSDAERRVIVHSDCSETELPPGYEWPFAELASSHVVYPVLPG